MSGPDPDHIRVAADFFAEAIWVHEFDQRPRPEHWNCRSSVRPQWGDGEPMTQDESDLIRGMFRGNEIITDPADRRGMIAQPVRGRTL